MSIPPHDVVGQGEPLLMLPGYAVGAESLARVRAPLSERFTVITFDYPGSGRAAPPLLPLSIPGLAARAVRLLDHLGFSSAHVYGLSMGGLVAQEMAIRFPERVRRLALVATTPGGPLAPRTDPWTFLAALSSVTGSGGGRVRLSGVVYQGFAAGLHDTSTRLHRIQADTLVLHGDQDQVVRVGNAHLLHRGIPSSDLLVIPGAGHFFVLEDPESAAAPVIDWCSDRAHPASPGRRGWVRRAAEPVSRCAAVPVGVARAWATAPLVGLVCAYRLLTSDFSSAATPRTPSS